MMKSLLAFLAGPRAPVLPRHLRTGRIGEAIAVRFLRKQGYRILGRNVRLGRRDEVDIVAFDPLDRTIVFAEVKSSETTNPDYPPELHLDHHKRQCLRRSARHYIESLPYEAAYRIDLICIEAGTVVRHYQEIGLQP